MDEGVVMQTSPLVHFLIDLNSSESEQVDTNVLTPFGATHSASRIAAADAGGFERGRRTADQDLRVALTDLQAKLAREHGEARRQWVEAEGARMAETLERGMAAIRMEMAASIARTLAPFVIVRMREQAVEDIVAAAEELVNDGMPLTIEVSGPPDLAAVVTKRLEPLATVVRLAPVTTPELRVRVDTRIIETRLNDWVSLIEDATT
jgi:hypothetical protein